MALTDQSTRTRSGEELDANLIDPYLKAHIPGPVSYTHLTLPTNREV